MNIYDPIPQNVTVRIQTNTYRRGETFVHERTMRIQKRLSDKGQASTFMDDCCEMWFPEDTLIRHFPKEDGLYQVVLHPDGFTGEYGPEYLEDWHYEFKKHEGGE